MEKYCKSCERVFKDSDFKICPYCGNSLSEIVGRQPIPRKLRHQVFQRDGYRCRECGATNKETRLHVDHIKPVSKGGTNDLDNLQTLCEECNRAKYTDEWIGGKHDSHMDNIDLKELNKKQMRINLSKHYNKNSDSNYNENDEYIMLLSSSENKLNDTLVLIIKEFIQYKDINIVAENVHIPPIQIKRWYRKGKKGDNDYKDFYEILLEINPNMEITEYKQKKGVYEEIKKLPPNLISHNTILTHDGSNSNESDNMAEKTSNFENKWKACPKCKKQINIVAKKCPYCNYTFKIDNTNKVHKETSNLTNKFVNKISGFFK